MAAKQTKKNYFTLIELNKRFAGNIFQDAYTKAGHYNVTYKGSNKVYTYKVKTLWELAEKLNLVTQADIMKMKGLIKLPCGCTVNKETYERRYKCINCQTEYRQPTQEELKEEEQFMEDWGL